MSAIPTDRLVALARVGRVINSSLVLDEVLDLVIDNLIEVTGAERGAILLLDPESADLRVRAARNLGGLSPEAQLFETSRNIVREVAESGVPRSIKDAGSDTTYGAMESVRLHNLRSILCAPLKVRDLIRGVLYVDNRLVAGAFANEDLALLTAFADQAAVAIENAHLYEELAQRERMRQELEIARSIQASLMPRQLPVHPGYDLAATCVPALAVGGDFYDAIVTSDGQIVLVLGDVSGKGVPAALLMGMVRTLLRAEVQRGSSLPEAVRHCNHVLYSDFTNTSMFATLLLGRLDPTAGTFTYVNCGHCEPILWREHADRLEYLAGDALPLGILDEFETAERTVRLDGGDILVSYSDGFSEALGPTGERFGVPRIVAALRASAHRSAQDILDDLGAAVDRFVEPEPQSDDETMIVLRAGVVDTPAGKARELG
jgi:sigma-B regulation protein RsbU (phosphoserine phosphatase)